MADPLSVAGSIAGLISIGETVFRKLYHYAKSVKDADEEILNLKKEVAALNGTLHNLRLVVEELEDGNQFKKPLFLQHVNTCLSTLFKLEAKLKEVEPSNKSRTRDTIRKLTWPYKSKQTNELADEVRRHRDQLNTAISADSMAALLKCLQVQEDVAGQVKSIDQMLRHREEIETRVTLDDNRTRVFKFFLLVNPWVNFNTSVKLRHSTTGFWLTENDTFATWLREPGSFLWLNGIPGAGKTILSGLVIQECLALSSSDRAVAYFYCDYKSAASQKTTNILGAIACQLAKQNKDALPILLTYYDSLHPENQMHRTPDSEGLISVIKDMASKFSDVRIVVDGLDECGDTTDEALDDMKELMGVAHGNISLAIFSREETGIRASLESVQHTRIEIAAQGKDIDLYVRAEMEKRMKSDRLRIRSPQLKEEIIDKLLSKAQGMFRWVSCQLDELCLMRNDAHRRKALDHLPKTLNETYERILMRIEGDDAVLVRRALQWVVYAPATLKIEELLDLLSIGDDGRIDPNERPDEEYILRICSSLVREVQGQLQLAHFTVQEYLEGIQANHIHLQQFRLNGTDTFELLRTSLRYLCSQEFNKPPPGTPHDFGTYFRVQKPWYTSLANCVVEFASAHFEHSEISKLFRSLFHPAKSDNFLTFVLERSYHRDDHSTAAEGRYSDVFANVTAREFRPLHAAAYIRLPEVCQWLLSDDGCDVNGISPAGFPLECLILGCLTDHDYTTWDRLTDNRAEQTLQVLLKGGADCTLKSRCMGSLAHMALSRGLGSEAFAQLLAHDIPLDQDALDFLKNNPDYLKGLIGSSDSWHASPEIQTILLSISSECSAAVRPITVECKNLSDNEFLETLKEVIQYNDCRSLTNMMNDVRFQKEMTLPGTEGTLLHQAMRWRAVEACELLLDHGFDPSQTVADGSSALHLCIRSCPHFDSLLIKVIATKASSVSNDQGHNVWHEAAIAGCCRALDLLVEKFGTTVPQVTTLSKAGLSPLLGAIVSQQPSAACYLLKNFNMDKASLSDRRLLHYSVAHGFLDVVKLLLELGVDAHAVSPDQHTALFFLTSCTTPALSAMLLEKGLDPGYQDAKGHTPLHIFLGKDARPYLQDAQVDTDGPDHLLPEVFTSIVTDKSVSLSDQDGRTAWFYFCTEFVAHSIHHASRWKPGLVLFGRSLAERGAMVAYESSNSSSAFSLLSKNCLESLEPSGNQVLSSTARQTLLALISAVLTFETSIKDDVHMTRLLVWSLEHNEFDLAQSLADKGANLHAQYRSLNNKEISVIKVACMRCGPEEFGKLLLHADPAQLNQLDHEGEALIHFLCSTSQTRHPSGMAKLRALLDLGVDIDVQEYDKGHATWTPLMFAARDKQREALTALLEHGANPQIVDFQGWGVVAWAVLRGSMKILECLKQHLTESELWCRPFDIFWEVFLHQNRISRCSVFHIAAGYGHSHVLSFLWDTGHLTDINSPSAEGVTPLHLAVWFNHEETAFWFIRKGADVNAVTKIYGMTALHLAVLKENKKMMKALLDAGACFERDSEGRTPDMIASKLFRVDADSLFQKRNMSQTTLEKSQKGRIIVEMMHKLLADITKATIRPAVCLLYLPSTNDDNVVLSSEGTELYATTLSRDGVAQYAFEVHGDIRISNPVCVAYVPGSCGDGEKLTVATDLPRNGAAQYSLRVHGDIKISHPVCVVYVPGTCGDGEKLTVTTQGGELFQATEAGVTCIGRHGGAVELRLTPRVERIHNGDQPELRLSSQSKALRNGSESAEWNYLDE